MTPTTDAGAGLRIAVCIKQVPDPSGVRFNPKSKRVVREDVENIVNPLDHLALGHALRLRDAVGGEVVAVTMGPPGSRACLEDAVRRGADRGLHLSDRRFAGADTLATVRALARALQTDFDLVLLGRSTLDGATAQVAPQLAELLGVPQVTQATHLEPAGAAGLVVAREGDEGDESVRLTLPAVVSVHRGPDPPEPDDRRRVQIAERTADDLGGGPRDFGTRGSPTFVHDLRPSKEAPQTIVLADEDAAIETLTRHLRAAREPAEGAAREAAATASRNRTIWALAERRRDGGLHPMSLETIACARAAADAYEARVVAVLPCDEPGEDPGELAAHGADAVLVLQDPALGRFSTAAFTAALCAAIAHETPDAIVGPWTTIGRDVLPRVAARLSLGLTGDFVALEVADPGDEADLLWVKPAWSGAVDAPIIAHTRPALGTLRPGAAPPLRRGDGRDVPVEIFRPDLGEVASILHHDPRGAALAEEERLDEAAVIVAVGGDASPRLLAAARRLAREHGGAIAGTALAVDAGLLPPQCEVGLLRRSVEPRLYLALGLHSAEDLAAARGADLVVTVTDGTPLPAHARVDIAIPLEPVALIERLLATIPQAA